MDTNALIAIIVAILVLAMIGWYLYLTPDENENESFSVLDGGRGVRSLQGNRFLTEVIGTPYRYVSGDELYFHILTSLPRRGLTMRAEGLYLDRGRYSVKVLKAVKSKLVLQLSYRRMGLPIIMTIERPMLTETAKQGLLKVTRKHPLYPAQVSFVAVKMPPY